MFKHWMEIVDNHDNGYLDRPGEFRGPRRPEKKSAKFEVRGMNLMKVRKILGPPNEL